MMWPLLQQLPSWTWKLHWCIFLFIPTGWGLVFHQALELSPGKCSSWNFCLASSHLLSLIYFQMLMKSISSSHCRIWFSIFLNWATVHIHGIIDIIIIENAKISDQCMVAIVPIHGCVRHIHGYGKVMAPSNSLIL